MPSDHSDAKTIRKPGCQKISPAMSFICTIFMIMISRFAGSCDRRFRCHGTFFFNGLIMPYPPVIKVYAVKRTFQRLQSMLTYFGLKLTLPNGNAVPPHGCQLTLFLQIALTVSFNFTTPELHIGLRKNIIPTPLVSVPEASVHKNHSLVFAQYNIWMPGKPRMVYPVSESATKQELPYNQFGLGILPFYRRHAMMPLFLCKFIHVSRSCTP